MCYINIWSLLGWQFLSVFSVGQLRIDWGILLLPPPLPCTHILHKHCTLNNAYTLHMTTVHCTLQPDFRLHFAHYTLQAKCKQTNWQLTLQRAVQTKHCTPITACWKRGPSNFKLPLKHQIPDLNTLNFSLCWGLRSWVHLKLLRQMK